MLESTILINNIIIWRTKLSEIWESFNRGGLIMWFIILQILLILTSIILCGISIHRKNKGILTVSNSILVFTLFTCSIGYHFHIEYRMKLLLDYINRNEKLSPSILISGTWDILIFPSFEIYFVLLIVILLITFSLYKKFAFSEWIKFIYNKVNL